MKSYWVLIQSDWCPFKKRRDTDRHAERENVKAHRDNM